MELRTDLAAGVEFFTVETRVDGERSRTTGALLGQSFVEGRRVAEYEALAAGTHEIEVTLLGAGAPIASRRVIVRALESRSVTVLITRDCVDIACPGDGDSSPQTECHGGRCVEPACRPGAPESCGPSECAGDGECPAGAACADPRCVAGACLLAADDSVCAATERCDVVDGCVDLPAPVDEDAGVDGGTDAGSGAMDSGPPDAGPGDAGFDAATPDAGPGDAGPPRTCDEVYSGNPGYVSCAERPTECEFVSDGPFDIACTTVCRLAGGTCVATYETSGGTCPRGATASCLMLYDSAVCVCTRPDP